MQALLKKLETQPKKETENQSELFFPSGLLIHRICGIQSKKNRKEVYWFKEQDLEKAEHASVEKLYNDFFNSNEFLELVEQKSDDSFPKKEKETKIIAFAVDYTVVAFVFDSFDSFFPCENLDGVVQNMMSVLRQDFLPEGGYYLDFSSVVPPTPKDFLQTLYNKEKNKNVIVTKSQAMRVEKHLRSDPKYDGMHAWTPLSTFVSVMT